MLHISRKIIFALPLPKEIGIVPFFLYRYNLDRVILLK